MIPEHCRDSYEATNQALIILDGLIAALDLVQDHIQHAEPNGPAAKAFDTINPLMRQKMAEVWGLRRGEWKAIGGKE